MPHQFPKITVVTASYNQGAYIEDCILSVLDQQYPNLEYIIIDGGSTDNTNEIIRKYQQHLAYYVSEKDNGLYDALNKGFLRSTGELMGWLNSDDILHRKSLFSIAAIFTNFNQVKWLQGYPTVIDEEGKVVHHRMPRSVRWDFLQKKYADGIFIQQESTYWHRSLWEKAGSFVSTSFKYAGDFELWMRFFNYEQLFTTEALIGAFRVRNSGQLSSDNYQAYLKECDDITDLAIIKLSPAEIKEMKNRVTGSNHFFSGFAAKKTAPGAAVNDIVFSFADKRFKMNV